MEVQRTHMSSLIHAPWSAVLPSSAARMHATTLVAALLVLAPTGGCSLMEKAKSAGIVQSSNPRGDTTGASTSKSPVNSVNPSGADTSFGDPTGRPPVADIVPGPVAPPVNVPPLPDNKRVTARAGARTVEAHAPTWCNAEFEPYREADAKNVNTLTRALDDLSAIARFACTWPLNPNQQQWTAAALQKVVNQLGMGQAQLSSYMQAKLNWGNFVQLENCPFTANDMDVPSDQARARVRAAVYCNARIGDFKEALWNSDRKPDLEPSVAVGLMYLGLEVNGGSAKSKIKKGVVEPAWLLTRKELLAHYAFFRYDIEHLDEDSFLAESNTFDLDDLHRGLALEHFYEVKRYTELLKEAFTSLEASYPGIGNAINDAPLAAHQQWAQVYSDNKQMLDQALQTEVLVERGDAAALRGCEIERSKAWQDYAASQNPTSKDDVLALAASPIGYLLLTSLFHCENFNGNVVHEVNGLLSMSAIQRGPRTAAQNASTLAVLVAKKENRRFPLSPQFMFSMDYRQQPVYKVKLDYGSRPRWGGNSGTVKSTREDGDHLEVVFNKEIVEIPILQCTETNKIDRINADGTLKYRENCTQTGTREVEVNIPTAHILKVRAAGIRPGAFVIASTASVRPPGATGPNHAYPMEVYQDESQGQLRAVFGVPIAR